MKKLFSLFCLLSFLSLINCTPPQKLTVVNEFLDICWTHSQEEDEQDRSKTTFRKCDFKEFGVSRFRFQFQLMDDQKCKFLSLAPNDAHFMTEGSWTFDDMSRTLTINSIDGKVVFSKILEKIEKDKLVFKNL